MSLPAWNRKAPSRATIAATLSALTVFGASSVATADVSQNGYQQPAYGYGFQGQQLPAAPFGPAFGYGPQSAPFDAPVQSAAPQGYAPQVPGYGLPQQVPGFGLPGGFPVPGALGFNQFGGGFQDYGFSSQWGNFAPSEPNYAPHERAGTKAPAPVAATASEQRVPANAGTKPAPATATTSDYSYEIAPTTNSTYVGSSTQFNTAPTTYSDPYQSIANQQSSATGYQTTTGYQTATPSYTQQYDSSTSYTETAPAQDYSNYVAAPEYNVAPSYSAPAATPNYTVAAPAPAAPAPVNVGRYEYQSTSSYEEAPSYQQAAPSYQQAAPSYQQQAAPSYQQAAPSYQQAVPSYQQAVPSYEPAPADYYDLNASRAAAAVAAPSYEVAAYAPQQQVAPRGGHFVQVGAFLDQARANRLVNKLGASGQQAFIVPAQVRGRLYHRVRIGAGSKRDARVIRNQVRELGYYEARVVKG